MATHLTFNRIIQRERDDGGEIVCNEKGEVWNECTMATGFPRLNKKAFELHFNMKNDSHIPAKECFYYRNLN